MLPNARLVCGKEMAFVFVNRRSFPSLPKGNTPTDRCRIVHPLFRASKDGHKLLIIGATALRNFGTARAWQRRRMRVRGAFLKCHRENTDELPKLSTVNWLPCACRSAGRFTAQPPLTLREVTDSSAHSGCLGGSESINGTIY